MCGIVGYVGTSPCRRFIINGLHRLEYRGYDSAGIVCINSLHKHFSYCKEAGGVSVLQNIAEEAQFDGCIGIGHTRWATHGVVDQKNAHPHFNCKKNIAVVHNGIIEDYESIRTKLIHDGHELVSTTDSEIAAHLFSSLLDIQKGIKQAVMALLKQLHGAYALVFILEEYPDLLVLVRHKSPLVVGLGANESFVASDYLAFSDKTNKVVFLPDECFAILKKDSLEIFDFFGNRLNIETKEIDTKYISIDKQGFEHFMLKEIYEQKRAIFRTITFYKAIGVHDEKTNCIWGQLGISSDIVKNLHELYLVGAGTSWHAARIGQFFFEVIAKIPTRVCLASEFRYMPFFPTNDSAFVVISQSGETADTLEALRLVNTCEIPTIAITNVASSTMVREATGFLPMQAGPEFSVASTKAFSTQLASLYWLAHCIAYERGVIGLDDVSHAEEELFVCAEVLESAIESYKLKITQELAPIYSKFDRFIFLGRHISYPFAMEAALKLKEISYIFSQCYPAGELKHGPIALIDAKTPVIIFSVLDELIYRKLISNAHEVKARGGHLVVFAFEGQQELISLADCAFIVPKVATLLAPLAMTGLMQSFAYHITRELGRPIDKPRNLAKSVTVE